MLKYRNILVYIDPTKEEQPALQRAIEIAEKDKNTHITLFLSCYDLTYEMTSLSSMEERQAMQSLVIRDNKEWLDTLAAPYREQGHIITCQVHWHNRPFQAAIQLILKEGFDLLIKSTHPHPRLSAILFTPTDWNLLRKCPIPLLLVKVKSWPENGNILCAVDCKSIEDPDHHNLNESILGVTARLFNIILSLPSIRIRFHLLNLFDISKPPISYQTNLYSKSCLTLSLFLTITLASKRSDINLEFVPSISML